MRVKVRMVTPEEEARLERAPENLLGDETAVCLNLGATTRWRAAVKCH